MKEEFDVGERLPPFEALPRDGSELVFEIERLISSRTKSRIARLDAAAHSDLTRLLRDLAARLGEQTLWSPSKIQKEILEPIANSLMDSVGTSRDREMMNQVITRVVEELTLLNTISGSKKANFDRDLLRTNIERIGSDILGDLREINRLREYSIQEAKKINTINRFVKNERKLRDFTITDEKSFLAWISEVSTKYESDSSTVASRVTYLNDWLTYVANVTPYGPQAILMYQKNPRSRSSFEERFNYLAQNNIFKNSWERSHRLLEREAERIIQAKTPSSTSATRAKTSRLEIKVNGKTAEFWFEIPFDQEPLPAEKQFAIIRESQKLPAAKPASFRYELTGMKQHIVISTPAGDDEAWVARLLKFAKDRLRFS
jgi:hypothetical protein